MNVGARLFRALVSLSLLLALSCGGYGDAKIGTVCAKEGGTDDCDPGEICAPKNASQSLLECSAICTRDVECGPAEACTPIKGSIKACTLD